VLGELSLDWLRPAGVSPPRTPLAALIYNNANLSFNLAALAFTSLAFVVFTIVGLRGLRKKAPTQQTKSAFAGSVAFGLFTILVLTGILHLRP
jgi:hypothetical protein